MRLGLAGSKEILSLSTRGGSELVCDSLLRQFRRAGARRVLVVIGHGKGDIPETLGDSRAGLDLAYLTIEDSPSTVHTLDRATELVADAVVAVGFPDIVLQPDDILARALDRQRATGADVVLGLLPARRPEKVDMVALDGNGAVVGIEIKPASTTLRYAWVVAVWTPAFTRFLHEYAAAPQDHGRELYVGDVILAARSEGIRVDGVVAEEGSFFDVGTCDELEEARVSLSA